MDNITFTNLKVKMRETTANQKNNEVNNHVHTTYSFSPYTPAGAAFYAWKAGLNAVGIMDHDSISGADEIIDSCKILGIASTCGFELRVNMNGTTMEGRKLNNPDSVNIAYMAVHGVPQSAFGEVEAFLAPLAEERNKRNRREVERLNSLIRNLPVEQIDFEKDVYKQSNASRKGSITERHILYALSRKITDRFGRGIDTVSFLEKSMDLNLSEKVKEYLLDESNPHYLYDLLGVLKSNFLSRFFIQPDCNECINVQRVVDFANSIGAIPSYAYLGDITDSATGDKKAEKFEDDFVEPLFEELKRIGYKAITYMPPRNSKEQLKRVQQLCSKLDFMEISGVDINSSRQTFNCPEVLEADFSHLIASTWALIAHEKLTNLNKNYSLFSEKNPLVSLPLVKRIYLYSKVGQKLNPADPCLTDEIKKLLTDKAGGKSCREPALSQKKRDDQMKQITEIASQIRGLSYKNNQPSIVSFRKEIKGPEEKTLTLSRTEEMEKSISDGVSAYILKGKDFPQCIHIDNIGYFLIGPDYDIANKTGLKRPEIGPHILKDKISVVTGGAQGFGEGIVRSLADYGSLVFIADMNIAGAEKLAEQLNKAKGYTTAFAVAVNVCDEESVENMIDEITSIAGGIDVFISNAGVLKAGSVKEMSLKDFDFVTSVDYTGYFICTKFVARLMAHQNKFTENLLTDIIQINSKSGLEGSNKNGAYAGAKFGGLGLTQSFALELIEDNIKVNSICPGNFLDGPLWSDPDRGLFVQYLNTGKVPGAKTLADVRAFYEAKVPMKRGCTTDDVMKALTYIVDQRYETGQAVPVTGGQLMLK